MELYSAANILFYIAMGLLFANIILKLFLVNRFYNKNEEKTLTADQRKTIKRISVPITIVASIAGAAAIVCYIILLMQ